MLSQRLFAIVVGILMLTSVASFALSSLYRMPSKEEVKIPAIIEKPLAPEERVQILQSGKVLIEYLYPEGCDDCSAKKDTYAKFMDKFKDYAVLEIAEVPENQTLDRIIGAYGDTEELKDIVTEDRLLEVFCKLAIVQPKECLLMEI